MTRPRPSLLLTLSLLLAALAFVLLPPRFWAQRMLPQTTTAHAASPGAATPLAEALRPDGTLQATAGSFNAAGYRMELAANGAPRFVPVPAATAAANCWDPQFTLPNGTNGAVVAVAVLGSDVYFGGLFTLAGNTVVNNVARFNTSTNTWSALGTGGGNGVVGVFGQTGVFALAVSGSDLYVGGQFTTANVGGTTISANRVAKVNTATGVWSALGTGGGNGVNSGVAALAVSGSDLYVGGGFRTANVGGTTVSANRMAKFNTATGVWSALGAGGGNGVNFTVTTLAVSGTDIFVGGAFTAAGNVAANNVAKFNTQTNTWSALGTGNGNGVSDLGSQVSALVVSGSDLYVGGLFATANVGGTTISANNVAKFNTLNNTWSALGAGTGNGVNGLVNALAVSGTDIFVGGQFTMANVGGTTVSTNNVAKVNTATGVWSALGTGTGNGVNNQINVLALSGGDLYVGGFFTTANVGGTTVSVNRVAKVNTANGVWSALGTGGGNGVNNLVNALAVSGSDLYVGGDFTTANVGGTTVSANRVAKVNPATGVWSALGTGGGRG